MDGKTIQVSEEAFTKLVLYTAQMGLSSSLAAKVAKSIAIRVVNCNSKIPFHATSKAEKRAFSTLMHDASEEVRRVTAPIHTVVWEAMATWFAEVRPNSQAVAQYKLKMLSVPPAQRLLLLNRTVRYVRIRGAWLKDRIVIECSVLPSSVEEALWSEMLAHIETEKLGYEAHGIAPKSGMERAVERLLKQFGLWHSQAE
jgi:hypothetical protein